MVDFVSVEKRSNIMRGVRSKNTRPERVVRSLLHRRGFRFRLHNRELPGKPDVTLPRYRVALFVHGCFWHNHEACAAGRMPSSNVEYWQTKISRTKMRDREHAAGLAGMGWRVLTIWECELADEAQVTAKMEGFIKATQV